MQLRILHRTVYSYDEPVKYTAQTLRLTPRREGAQRVLSWSIRAPGRRTEQVDAHGNITHLLTLEEPHRAIEIDVRGWVEMTGDEEFMRFDGTLSPLAYLAPTPLTAASAPRAALAHEALRGGGERREQLYRLAAGVCQAVRYMPGTTSV